MRYIIPVIVAGTLLSGCLAKEASNVDENGFANTPGSSGTAGNAVPTISGSPSPSVKYENSYYFRPNASDADGDSLTFTVQNLPTWASFSESSGRIAGQPRLENVGVYDNITITVSDGKDSVSLAGFSITVTETANGSVTLSWVAPTENMDGSPLTNLSGYTIYYGKSSGAYEHQVRIDNPSISEYVVEELDPTTYYFAATAFNADGTESSFSSEIAKRAN